MNLQTIEAYTSADNHNSTKLLEKSNFKKNPLVQGKSAEKVKLKNMVIYSLENPAQTKK